MDRPDYAAISRKLGSGVAMRMDELEAIAKTRKLNDTEMAEATQIVHCFEGNRKQRRAAISKLGRGLKSRRVADTVSFIDGAGALCTVPKEVSQ
jgi:hypothetical protein